LVPPAEFMAMAEETGLITTIGEWVLRTGCVEAASWPQPNGHTTRLAINVSARQVSEEAFNQLVAQILDQTGLAPDRLELEITETSALARTAATAEMIRRIRALGVHVYLDDLGTGYSSLNALRQLPVDGIKIDRSFVADVATDSTLATITAGLIAIANGLGLEVTAEGVETREQMAFLRECGCYRMQGYLFSKPLASDELAALLEASEAPWEQELPD
jgi:EAL domain-containing protein (putative c-di-GMP-specific phosphodiesterase class I)